MSNFEFLIWLLGFLELCDSQPVTPKMLFIIRNHANLVKAVEKDGLGPLNTEIYQLVAQALHDDTNAGSSRLFDVLTEKVKSHFANLLPHA